MIQEVQIKKHFILESYVVFDIATSGLSPEDSSLLGIFAIRIEKGEIAERFNKIVRNQEELSEFMTDATKLTNEMLNRGESAEQVLNDFQVFCGNLGIQVCRAKTRGSYKFSKPESEQKGIVQVMNKNLKETLLHIMPEWKVDRRYKVEGIHIPEDKAFVFELTKFEELADFRKN